MFSPCRTILVVLILASGAGCGPSTPDAASTPAAPERPAPGMKWAETADFRSEIPVEWLASPQSIAPSAVTDFTSVKSGFLIGVPRADSKTNPLPIVFSIVVVSSKMEQVKNQYALDSLIEVSRRGMLQSEETIQVDGQPATRIVTSHDSMKLTSYGLFAMTPRGVLAITAEYLPSEDYALIRPDLDRFVSKLKLLP